MKIIAPLMTEHRLIERMIKALAAQTEQMAAKGQADVEVVTVAVDFLRTYADRTHHGKEEDILFKDLATRQINPIHRQAMDELVRQHNTARGKVTKLVEAKEGYRRGQAETFPVIIECLRELISFYPRHITMEERDLFHPCLEYFTDAEQEAMLRAFWEFDRTVIHEKYRKIVEQAEARKDSPQ